MNWGIFRSRSLAAVLVAELVSITGSAMTYIALSWFVLATTGSPALMGWVLAAEMLPMVLFGIPSGSLIAWIGAKRAMNLSDAARVPLLALIPVLHWTGHLNFPVLLIIAFLIGCFAAPYSASSRVILPEVVGEDEQLVARGSAFLQAGNQLSMIVGPILGGILIAWRGAPVVLVIDAVTYLFSFLVIFFFVRVGARVEATAQSRGVLAGLRYILRDRLLGPITAVAAGLNGAFSGFTVALPVLAFRRYHHDVHVAGFFFAAFGIGALLGSLAMGHLATKAPMGRMACYAIIAAVVPLWLLTIPMPWQVLLIVLGTFSFLMPFVNAPILGLLTVRPPEALRAKVLTAVMTVTSIAAPLGLVAFGVALAHLSITTTFVIISALCTLGAVGFAIAMRRYETETPAASALVAQE